MNAVVRSKILRHIATMNSSEYNLILINVADTSMWIRLHEFLAEHPVKGCPNEWVILSLFLLIDQKTAIFNTFRHLSGNLIPQRMCILTGHIVKEWFQRTNLPVCWLHTTFKLVAHHILWLPALTKAVPSPKNSYKSVIICLKFTCISKTSKSSRKVQLSKILITNNTLTFE